MRINGTNYKSIVFTVLRDKLLDFTKTQTFRLLFIPSYKTEDPVAIVFKAPELREFLYLVHITKYYPRKIKDLTLEEAHRDGFETIAEFQRVVMELNKKTIDDWGFIIQWDPIKSSVTKRRKITKLDHLLK